MSVRKNRAAAGAALLCSFLFVAPVSAQVVISQAYGGGGNSGATYTHDFIELFNRGATAQSLSGWSVQYASATGTSWTNKVDLPAVSLQPGQYYLIQMAQGGGGSTPLPTPDLAGTVNMSGTNFKVALVSTTTVQTGTCPTGAQILDFVGTGTANCFEGTGTAPVPSNSTAAIRNGGGCDDTDQNASDFTAAAPTPRNSAAPLNVCGGPSTPQLTINDVSLAEGDSGTTDFAFTVTLSADADASFSVDWRIEDGSATVGDDYVGDSGTLNFAATAGEQSITVSVVGDTQAEPDETFTVILENLQGATVDIANAIGTGTIVNDDLGHTEIFAIQGSGAASPFAGQTVRTENNVVTGVGADGFAMQTPDSRADGVVLTSDGIFVFTGSAPQCDDGGSPRAVAVGDLVHVQGTVVEYFGLTEFSGGISVECVGAGQALPTAVVFEREGSQGDIPSLDPDALYCGEIDGQQNNFECLEGMLVSIPQGIVTKGNQRFSGDDYGPVHIGPHGVRALREPGVRFGNTLEPGGNDAAGIWDGNPEMLEMDADRFGAVPAGTELVGGATFQATAIVSYSFSDYELWPTILDVDAASNRLPRPVRARLDAAELSIGSFNMWRLCNTLDDQPQYECGNGGEPSQAELEAQIARLGTYVAEVLNAPDVLGVQEVETQAVLQALGDWIDANHGVPYQAYLVDGNDGGGIDNGFLVRTDRISEVVVTQLQGDLTWADPEDGGALSPLHDRPPLLLTAAFATEAGGRPLRFAVMNNHTKSRSGVDNGNADGQRNRAKRFHQGLAIAQAVQDYQSAVENADAPLVLVGDYNDYQFSDGYVHIVGLATGTYDDAANTCDVQLGNGTPEDCDLGGPNPVSPPLLNLVDVISGVEPNEAYSYLFTENFGNIQGQARDVPTMQVLDHVMVSSGIAPLVVDAAYGRANLDASLQGLDDGSGPDGAGGTQFSLAIGSSDHDGLVAFLDTDCSANPGGDDDGDGVCDLVDNCPAVANADQSDGNDNGIGDACDADIPPVANDDAFTVEEDSGTTTLDVLANDTDADGGPMEVAGTYGSSNSSTSSSPTAVFYTPNADYCGTDSFDYDLNGGSRATVTVTVTCVDDPPVAVDDAVTLRYDDGEVAIDVLANDIDVDGGPMEIISVTQGSGGTVGFSGTSVSYAAQDGFCGADSFTYTVNGGGSATVQVTVLCERIFRDGFETD